MNQIQVRGISIVSDYCLALLETISGDNKSCYNRARRPDILVTYNVQVTSSSPESNNDNAPVGAPMSSIHV